MDEVDRVEDGCKAALLAMSVFFGLVRFMDTPSLSIPAGGGQLLLFGLTFVVIGMIPFGPMSYSEDKSSILDSHLRKARTRRATKALLLAAALLCLGLVVVNLQHLNLPFQIT